MENADNSIVTSNNESNNSLFSNLNLVIFQCVKCNSIVGDSTSWVSATKTIRSITLAGVSKHVGTKKNLKISDNGVDKGSTFYEVYCMVCNTVLGKTYVASPPDLDHIRGAFTLAAETLNSYEVGSSDVSLSMNADVTNKALDERLQKLQYVVCILEERIKKLEGVVCPHDNPSTSDYNHVPDQNIKLQDRESVTSSESALCSDIGLRQPISGMVEHHDDHGSVVTRQNDGSDQSVPLEYLQDGNRRLKRKRAR